MDPIKEKFERFVGEKFIEWINSNRKSHFVFLRRGDVPPDEAPDLIFTDGGGELGVEVSSEYYDKADAKLIWEVAREKMDAPRSWSGMNFEDALVANITRVISTKAAKQYGSNCMLVIYVEPRLTESEEMCELAARVEVPDQHSFRGIYILGKFSNDYDIIPLYSI